VVGVCTASSGNRMLAQRGSRRRKMAVRRRAAAARADAVGGKFGMRWVPFARADLAGSIRLALAKGLRNQVGDRRALCETGRSAQNDGKGSYKYAGG